MKRQSTHRRFPLILLSLVATVLLNVASAGPCHAGLWPFGPSSPEEEAYEKSRDEFNAVHKGVSETKDAITTTGVYSKLDGLEKKIQDEMEQLQRAGKKVPKNLKDAAAKVNSAKTLLNQSQGVLENFTDYSGKVTTALDVYDEMVRLNKEMAERERTLGELGAALGLLGEGMTWAEDVPILGQAIAEYGKVTLKMLDKLGEVSTAIDKRNQDTIGTGATDTNERARIFREFVRSHPELKGAVNYEPAKAPPYLYVPEYEGRDLSVLWDADGKQFTVVPKSIPVKDIFRMKLLTGERLSASELVMHMEEWPKGGAKRYELSREVYKFLNQLKTVDWDVMSDVSDNSHAELFALLRNPRMFEARYVYDRQTHDQLHRDIKEIHDRFIAKGDQKSIEQATKIRNWAKRLKLGIVFTKPEPVEAKKPENKKAGGKEPSLFDAIVDAVVTEFKKPARSTSQPAASVPQPEKPGGTATPTEVKPAAVPAAPAKPATKAGNVVGTCGECYQSGLECACGKAACRCCAPGDSSCNAYDL